MALPKEPRQKMINIMYLVLTAMLALNVSAEILNAFKTVKRSLELSSDAIEQKNVQIFKSFNEKLKDPTKEAKAKEWLPYAEKAKALSDATYKYIEDLKSELIMESGAKTATDTVNYKPDDLDAATRLFVEQKKKGPQLLQKLDYFKKQLMEIHPDIKAEFEKTLPIDLSMPKTQNKELRTWEAAYFHMTPSIAALTILSKFQNDIRNCEAQVVEFCHKKVGEVEITYDKFEVIASSSSSYMMPDEEGIIYAGLASFSSKAAPTITVDGQTATSPTPGEPAQVKFRAEGVGPHTKKVVVIYKDPNTGKEERVEKEIKYEVGQPAGITVSTDKTRVFYADGAENELSVTGPAGAELIDVDVAGPGNIEKVAKGNGLYVIKCSQPGKATVTVTDKKSGKKIPLIIPIKPVPDPIPKLAEKRGGDLEVTKFKTSQGVAARMPQDFIFGNMAWTVTSFRIYFTGTGFEESGGQEVNVKGNLFNSDVQKLMAKCQAGTTVIIDLINIQNNTGSRRPLEESLTFVLQ
jgi:gliding motility-associated protein GldM